MQGKSSRMTDMGIRMIIMGIVTVGIVMVINTDMKVMDILMDMDTVMAEVRVEEVNQRKTTQSYSIVSLPALVASILKLRSSILSLGTRSQRLCPISVCSTYLCVFGVTFRQ